MVDKTIDMDKLKDENAQLQYCIELLERVAESNAKTVASFENDMVTLEGALEINIPIDSKPRAAIERLHSLGDKISSLKEDLQQSSSVIDKEVSELDNV